MLLIAKVYGTNFIQSISYWFMGPWSLPNLLPLTTGASARLHACIMYWFRIFCMCDLCDRTDTSFFYLGKSQFLRHKMSSWDFSYKKYEGINLLVSNIRFLSLLANKISSTYTTRKMNHQFLNFASMQVSSMFFLKPKLLIVLSNLRYHYLKACSIHKWISSDGKTFGLSHEDIFNQIFVKECCIYIRLIQLIVA